MQIVHIKCKFVNINNKSLDWFPRRTDHCATTSYFPWNLSRSDASFKNSHTKFPQLKHSKQELSIPRIINYQIEKMKRRRIIRRPFFKGKQEEEKKSKLCNRHSAILINTFCLWYVVCLLAGWLTGWRISST